MFTIPSALERAAVCAGLAILLSFGCALGPSAAMAAVHKSATISGHHKRTAAVSHHRRTHTISAVHHRRHARPVIDLADTEDSAPVRRHRHVRVASLNGGEEFVRPHKSITGGNLSWNASQGCLASDLRNILAEASTLATIRVNSTCRSPSHNRAVGGAGHSYHLSGEAADFHVYGNVGRVYAFLRNNSAVGGLKHYGGGVFHIDTGPRRSW